MKTVKIYMLVFAAALLLVSCNENSSPSEYTENMVSGIINEGTMNAGNGEISYYNEDTKVINNNFFSSVNPMSIGASIQAASYSQAGVLALVCTNPDKIFFTNVITGKMLTTVPFTTDLKTPRGIAMRGTMYSTDMAYITNWGEPRVIGEWEPGHPMCDYPNSYILAVSLSTTPTVMKKILCGNTAEGILLTEGKLFVALQEGVKVYDAVTYDSIGMITPKQLTGAARQFVTDKNQNVWVSIEGSGIMGFSPTTLGNVIEYPATINYDGKIAISADGKSIYSYDTDYTIPNVSSSNVFKIDLTTGGKSNVFTESNALYGIGVNPFTGRIYTANPNAYTDNSIVTIYNTDGTQYDRKTTGISTSGFFFFGYLSEE